MTHRPPSPAPSALVSTLEEARLGRLDGVQEALDDAATQPALSLALRARSALFLPAGFRSPEVEELRAVAENDGAALALREAAALDLMRRRILDFQGDSLAEVAASLPGGRDSLARKTIELWQTALGSSGEWDDATARRLESAAGATKDAELVLELCCARALGAEGKRDMEVSLETARRGSRMARTEARPLHEFFAHLILARARRLTRHPHLAIRVLSSLAEYAPKPFHPWIAWELFFAGATKEEIDHRVPGLELGAHGSFCVQALFRLTDAARAGDAAGFASAHVSLERCVRDFAPLRSDAEALIAALRPAIGDPGGKSGLRDWQEGRTVIAPIAIHGLCVRAEREESDELSETYVFLAPKSPPSRILGIGAPLLEAEGAVRLRRTRRKQGRVETMAAVLALAGFEGMSLPDAFRAAYGFDYVADLHRGVVDVLMQRVRNYVVDAADIVRREGHIALQARTALLVPDPRCAPAAYDRVLRILAREGRAKAAQAASATGLSVRAAQNALRELSEAGLCSVERQGRQVLYRVEDTTFSEPTLLIKSRRSQGG